MHLNSHGFKANIDRNLSAVQTEDGGDHVHNEFAGTKLKLWPVLRLCPSHSLISDI